MGINLLIILGASLSVFLLGGLWYSPLMFGHAWQEAEQENNLKTKKGHGVKVFIYAYGFAFFAALGFASFLPANFSFFDSLMTGFLIGLCFVGSSFGINYLFAGRSFKLFWIDAGYHLCQFTLYGLIFGLWR
ncbi:MAG: DUF1761 domain-containing protein [Alphaproteobacteria bacterium]|nr:DUF1761 domain-containing protein [Alphaproteobacteria bacterium]